MEFLQVPLFDDDIYKLMIRMVINLVVLACVVGLCYHRHQKSRQFLFTFVLMNVMVFFICFTLKKLDIGLGMALGLFAIFAIIRYRTDAIRVKEMTYLFIVIGIAVINALSNKKTSYAELAFTNAAILVVTYLFEVVLLRGKNNKSPRQEIVYDRIELLHPVRRNELIADIEKRIGVPATRIKIDKIDLKKDQANLTIFYSSVDDTVKGCP